VAALYPHGQEVAREPRRAAAARRAGLDVIAGEGGVVQQPQRQRALEGRLDRGTRMALPDQPPPQIGPGERPALERAEQRPERRFRIGRRGELLLQLRIQRGADR
jgi:hypothetical protein